MYASLFIIGSRFCLCQSNSRISKQLEFLLYIDNTPPNDVMCSRSGVVDRHVLLGQVPVVIEVEDREIASRVHIKLYVWGIEHYTWLS